MNANRSTVNCTTHQKNSIAMIRSDIFFCTLAAISMYFWILLSLIHSLNMYNKKSLGTWWLSRLEVSDSARERLITLSQYLNPNEKISLLLFSGAFKLKLAKMRFFTLSLKNYSRKPNVVLSFMTKLLLVYYNSFTTCILILQFTIIDHNESKLSERPGQTRVEI